MNTYYQFYDEVSRESKREVCSAIDEIIVMLENWEFFSPNDDEYVAIYDDTVIHRDDYINALSDLKFRLECDGNWVE